MTLHTHGPFAILPDCSLWISEFQADTTSDQTDDPAAAKMDRRDLERWQRYRPLAKKRQFLNSRLAVRTVLDREFGSLAEDWRLTADQSGRPTLRSPDGNEVCKISLSHSESLTAVAIMRGMTDVGVDIEALGGKYPPKPDNPGISPHEVVFFHQFTGMNLEDASTTVWSIKESVWKAVSGAHLVSPSQISLRRDSTDQLFWSVKTPEICVRGPLNVFVSARSPMRTASTGSMTTLPDNFGSRFVGCLTSRPPTEGTILPS